MKKIIKYVVLDIIRNRIIIAYTLFLLVISFSIFNLEDNASKGILGLLNLVLIIVPLVSIIFSTIYIYNAAEFIELLVAQPLKRISLWSSLYSGLAMSLCFAFFTGCGLPILIYSPNAVGMIMIIIGCAMSLIFAALALLASVLTRDKAKGIGVSILLWLYFTLIFDGIILFLLFQFMDYPLEKPLIVLSSLNPVDLARVMVLLKLDVSALMGATSATFREFFGSTWGSIFVLLVLSGWIFAPLCWSVRKFNRKDL